MQGHRRRREDAEISRNPPSARKVAAGRHRFLCRSSSTMHTDIVSSSFRELDAVALATNVTLSMKRGTERTRRSQPVADPNRMSGTFFRSVASVLPS